VGSILVPYGPNERLSFICAFDLSAKGLRKLASQRNMTEPRIIIAPQTYAYGVLRMFQGLSEPTRPPALPQIHAA
jgi:hypothetical protein